MDRASLAAEIYATSHLTGEFILRAGNTSHEYFDKYLFEASPVTLHAIATLMAELVPDGTELLAGLEMGGIPIATMLSQITGIPSLFVRKEAKAYGTQKLAEGPEFSGRRVVIVEDVVSSGGQISLSCEDLRSRDAVVSDALCVIDRESGGRENLAATHIHLSSLFRMSDLTPHR